MEGLASRALVMTCPEVIRWKGEAGSPGAPSTG